MPVSAELLSLKFRGTGPQLQLQLDSLPVQRWYYISRMVALQRKAANLDAAYERAYFCCRRELGT